MVDQLTLTCDIHPDPWNCPDAVVVYNRRTRSIGLPVRDGEYGQAVSSVAITFCPWCGERLPPDLRDAFWDALEAAGFPDADLQTLVDPRLPEEFKSDAWWLRRGL